MSDNDSNWKFADEAAHEDEVLTRARQQSLELGVTPVSPGVGAQAAVVAAAARPAQILEIGTGAGVSGLWLLRGAPQAMLTSIDAEARHQTQARRVFEERGVPSRQVRLIPGRSHDLLPRMNEASYDLVLVDADPAQVLEDVEHALRLARPGGTVLVAHALWHGRVADPAARDDTTAAFRALATEIASSPSIVSALSLAGDGLLQLITPA